MASCAHIDQLLQPYLDGELTHAERVILEQHVADCDACRILLRDHQRSNAILFEAFAPARLDHDLTEYVLSHVPEFEEPTVDVAGLNRRAKHPSAIRERVFRLIPIAAAFFLVFMAAIINKNWPDPVVNENAIGLVAYTEGNVHRIDGTNQERDQAVTRTPAGPGDRFETGPQGKLMVLLAGPSELRAAENTRVLIRSDREISVEKGRVFLDVAKGIHLFRVLTPSGQITVFGTRFDVTVSAERTTVVVEEGEVQLSDASDNRVFGVIRPNQRGYVQQGLGHIPIEHTSAAALTQWARDIKPDPEAKRYFEAHVQPLFRVAEVSGESGYIVNTMGKPLKSIVLHWEKGPVYASYCDYEVYVYDHHNDPVFSTRLDGEIFNDPRLTEVEIENTGNHRRLNAIVVKVVPVPDPARSEVRFTELNALVLESGN